MAEPLYYTSSGSDWPQPHSAAGRYFYTCQRPEGPAPEGKCEYFK
jgi:hypothetical protein